MKKILTLLTAMVCVLCLSACGGQQKEINPLIGEMEARQTAEGIVSGLNDLYVNQMMDQYLTDPQMRQMAQPWLFSAIESWQSGMEDFGTLDSIKDYSVEYQSDMDMIIKAFLKGSIRDAEVEIVVKKGEITSVAFNVNYSFAEQMQKAGLNTLLGMGTVFAVLILISLIISLFKYIPDIQAGFAKKEEKPAAPTPKAAPAPAPTAKPAPVATVSNAGDDGALLAVIAAAVAAYEGSEGVTLNGVYYNANVDTGDSYVVRSIKRAARR